MVFLPRNKLAEFFFHASVLFQPQRNRLTVLVNTAYMVNNSAFIMFLYKPFELQASSKCFSYIATTNLEIGNGIPVRRVDLSCQHY